MPHTKIIGELPLKRIDFRAEYVDTAVKDLGDAGPDPVAQRPERHLYVEQTNRHSGTETLSTNTHVGDTAPRMEPGNF